MLKSKAMLKVSEISKTYFIVNLENIGGQFGDQPKVEMEDFSFMTLSKEVMRSLIKSKSMGLVFRGIKTIEKFEKDTVLVEFVEL